MQIFSQNGPWSVPNKQNPSFYSIFHAFSRSRFSPDWPVPIPGPYPPFPAIIHLYRPSIPPTCSSNFALPNFYTFFSRYSQSLYKTHTRETRFSSLPIGNFHPNMDTLHAPHQPKFTPFPDPISTPYPDPIRTHVVPYFRSLVPSCGGDVGPIGDHVGPTGSQGPLWPGTPSKREWKLFSGPLPMKNDVKK